MNDIENHLVGTARRGQRKRHGIGHDVTVRNREQTRGIDVDSLSTLGDSHIEFAGRPTHVYEKRLTLRDTRFMNSRITFNYKTSNAIFKETYLLNSTLDLGANSSVKTSGTRNSISGTTINSHGGKTNLSNSSVDGLEITQSTGSVLNINNSILRSEIKDGKTEIIVPEGSSLTINSASLKHENRDRVITKMVVEQNTNPIFSNSGELTYNEYSLGSEEEENEQDGVRIFSRKKKHHNTPKLDFYESEDSFRAGIGLSYNGELDARSDGEILENYLFNNLAPTGESIPQIIDTRANTGEIVETTITTVPQNFDINNEILEHKNDILNLAQNFEQNKRRRFGINITKQITNKINNARKNGCDIIAGDFIDNITAYMYVNRENEKKATDELTKNIKKLVGLYVGGNVERQKQMIDNIVQNYREVMGTNSDKEIFMVNSIDNLGLIRSSGQQLQRQ